MSWSEYRLARGAGYSVWDSFRSAFLNADVPSRAAEIDAEIRKRIARVEKTNPALAEELRRNVGIVRDPTNELAELRPNVPPGDFIDDDEADDDESSSRRFPR
jgi:hypothetical protein